VKFTWHVGRHTGVALNIVKPCSVCGLNFPFAPATSYLAVGVALRRDEAGETPQTCQDCLFEKADAVSRHIHQVGLAELEEKNDG
jgi:hypothetical protein